MAPERTHRSLPVATAGIAAAALYVSLGPTELRAAFELRRDAVLAGEIWRLLGGHLVHYHASLLLWDVGALVLLGAWIEYRSRSELLGALLLGALFSGVAVVVLRPDLGLYQGSSALATALLVAGALRLLERGQPVPSRVVAGLALVGLALKIAVEMVARVPVTPALDGAQAVESVGLAHLAGAAAGAAVRRMQDRGRLSAAC